MKIRVMGTKEECELAKIYYRAFEQKSYVKSVQVSNLYANRGSNTVYRIYVDIEYQNDYLKLLNKNLNEGGAI